ncbi:Plasma membrane proteolipid 3 [Vanrija pseudolonga]|uniref:Plasma membrane proteolipid 3 n=2 Tax=Vanrija TaxID=1851468 RepID=A0AAF0YAX9_9TREE|nr:Plasma membrane proteolipid 3 [Vanrija pseudolonga]
MVRGSDILIALIIILFPPAGVAILTGCSCDLLIAIGLTILGYLPGHLYGFYILWKKMRAEELYGDHGYVYLGNGEFVPRDELPPQLQQPYYGSTAA